MDDTTSAATQLVRRLKMGDNPHIQVGVVEFNDTARTRTPLTNIQSRVIGGINGIAANGGTAIDRGIDQGVRVLAAGRDNAGEGPIEEFMIVLSDGENNRGCSPVSASANRAKGQGIVLASVCVGPECDHQCMRRVATTPALFYEAEHSDQLDGVFQRIRRDIVKPTQLRRLRIEEELDSAVRYVPDSSSPAPVDRGEADATLAWERRSPPEEGITVTYAVEVLVPGFRPASLTSRARIWDSEQRQAEHALPVPFLLALEPRHLATVTPPPTATPIPTPTSPPPPTATVAPTATAVPSATPVIVRVPIYLPFLAHEACDPLRQRADIVLVLDTSSSMAGAKLEDAKTAAIGFVSLLDLEPGRDRVAVVRFDGTAQLIQRLTRDREAIEAGLRSVGARSGTHIDTGLAYALDELTGARGASANVPVAVLLTDGIHNGAPGADLETAERVRDADIALYVIGLGTDVDEGALVAMAGGTDRYVHAPDSSHLARIYRDMARDLECP